MAWPGSGHRADDTVKPGRWGSMLRACMIAPAAAWPRCVVEVIHGVTVGVEGKRATVTELARDIEAPRFPRRLDGIASLSPATPAELRRQAPLQRCDPRAQRV